jgi:hypothetical protein
VKDLLLPLSRHLEQQILRREDPQNDKIKKEIHDRLFYNAAIASPRT